MQLMVVLKSIRLDLWIEDSLRRDYEEKFSPMVRYTSIKTILSFVIVMKWKVHQMDVKTTLSNGEIKEEVYVEQPQGF